MGGSCCRREGERGVWSCQVSECKKVGLGGSCQVRAGSGVG